MKKNVASQNISAEMITAADGSDFAGTVTVLVTKDGGTQASSGGTVSHKGSGEHNYAPTQAETNADFITFTFKGTGAITAGRSVYTSFPQTVDNDTLLSSINSDYSKFNPAADTVANVTLVGTTTTNTDMVGTNNALLSASYTAPDNASIDAILTDTNELQLNQGDWLTATGFNTVVPPSLAEFNARSLPSADYFIVTDYTAPDNSTIASIDSKVDNIPTVTEFNARTLPSASYSQFDYTSNEVNANVAKINGFTVLGTGTSGNLWRA